MLKKATYFLGLISILYLSMCLGLYFFQEKILFHPQTLPKNYPFKFSQPFEEKVIITKDGKKLNGLLFKSKNPKGLIFYLHGNAGSLDSWGEVAEVYTNLNFDVFILDYRGYGKSEGKIESEIQIFDDVQTVYNQVKKSYSEDRIIVLGYSIGTGLASKIASNNSPKMLILQAPYFSLNDMLHHTIPFIPELILKYKFDNSKYIKLCKMPVVIFHGDNDEVIYLGSSLKLQKLFKSSDTLFILKNQVHNGITNNPEYLKAIKKILN